MKTSRNLKMMRLRKSGKTYRELATMFGITHQCVRQTLLQHFKNVPRLVKGKFKVYLLCRWCGKTFIKYSKPTGKHHYCSLKCVYKARNKHRSVAFLKERNRRNASKYYWEVLRKKKNFHEIIRKNNKKQLCKTKQPMNK